MAHLQNNSNNSTNAQSQFNQLTQLTPNLCSITSEHANNHKYESNAWKTPQKIIDDIKQLQPQIEYLIDLCPAEDQITFNTFCKNASIIPLKSHHSIEKLTRSHLQKLLNINPKYNSNTNITRYNYGFIMNPPFNPAWRAFSYLIKVLSLLKQLPKTPLFFIIPKDRLTWNATQFATKIYPEYKPYIFQPERPYEYLNKHLIRKSNVPFDTVILGFGIDTIHGTFPIKEILKCDCGSKQFIIRRIVEHFITDDELIKYCNIIDHPTNCDITDDELIKHIDRKNL